ncbi:MAG: hypothetical protein AAFX93_11260 [Verrucomicrobiota bacterium]
MPEKDLWPQLPPHVSFPEEWEHIASHGVGKFVTRVLHRLPSGHIHIWTSRRHRKRRGGVIHDGSSKLAQSDSGRLDVQAVHQETRGKPRSWKWWGWRLKSLSWWLGLIFFLGSICFVVGTVPVAFPVVLEWINLPPYNFGLVCFIGSVFFTFGSYLLLLEALNADLDITLQMKAGHLERYLTGQPYIYPSIPRIRWIGWEPKRLDFLIAIVQLSGAIIFNINCGMALVEGMNWLWIDILVWTPSTLASCCFVTAGYLGIVEVAHRPWAWLLWDMTWWINWFSLLGSLGFLISSLVGYFGQGPIVLPQWFGNYFALMMGSWFFLASTYLLVPETLIEEKSSTVLESK